MCLTYDGIVCYNVFSLTKREKNWLFCVSHKVTGMWSQTHTIFLAKKQSSSQPTLFRLCIATNLWPLFVLQLLLVFQVLFRVPQPLLTIAKQHLRLSCSYPLSAFKITLSSERTLTVYNNYFQKTSEH